MNKLELIFDDDSLFQADNGQIFGNIYFKYKDICFPEKNWNEFIVIVSTWWLTSILNMSKDIPYEERFPFMDGPYEITVTSIEGNLSEIIFTDSNKIILKLNSYNLQDFIKQILDISIRIKNKCLEKKYYTEDIQLLENLIFNIENKEKK